MALNLLKNYNELLEFLYPSERRNLESIKGVFNRDFGDEQQMYRNFAIRPTTADGENTMDRLFRHLTTVITDEKTRKREFDFDRTVRMHWIKHHIIENQVDNVIAFTIEDERRAYILDKNERYVIVLEPSRTQREFFLLSAYNLMPSRYKNLMKKYEKRGRDGIEFA